jgi:hypothetical protein
MIKFGRFHDIITKRKDFCSSMRQSNPILNQVSRTEGRVHDIITKRKDFCSLMRQSNPILNFQEQKHFKVAEREPLREP